MQRGDAEELAGGRTGRSHLTLKESLNFFLRAMEDTAEGKGVSRTDVHIRKTTMDECGE